MSGAIAYVHGIAPDAENRQRDDFYPTPPAATRALLGVESFVGGIREPACGDGAISRVLEAAGYQVESSDLINRGYGVSGIDFLLDYQTTADNTVTNPPFKLAEEFVEHALARTRRKVAMLCRLGWLEGRARGQMFQRTPLARVWVFSNRVPMLRNGDQMMAGGGGMIAFAWYVWDHAHRGAPTLGWILASDSEPVASLDARADAAYDPAEDARRSYAVAIEAMRTGENFMKGPAADPVACRAKLLGEGGG